MANTKKIRTVLLESRIYKNTDLLRRSSVHHVFIIKFAVIPFTITHDVGVYLPPNAKDRSPRGFFELFFSEDIVVDICCCNEYAEDTKSKHPYMYKHYKFMSNEDFLKLVGLLIHFGYRKIPQYWLAWRWNSLCFDPFVAATMTRNRFESLMCVLHMVDKVTEQDLKKKINDKLAKVSMVVCVELYNTHTYNIYILQLSFCVDSAPCRSSSTTMLSLTPATRTN